MSGFTVYYIDGGYTEFPLGGGQADAVVEWFRTAADDSIISLRSEADGTTHAVKRHISRIAVDQ